MTVDSFLALDLVDIVFMDVGVCQTRNIRKSQPHLEYQKTVSIGHVIKWAFATNVWRYVTLDFFAPSVIKS